LVLGEGYSKRKEIVASNKHIQGRYEEAVLGTDKNMLQLLKKLKLNLMFQMLK
jgi:hypothetical protein